jgi:hypothetical protein
MKTDEKENNTINNKINNINSKTDKFELKSKNIYKYLD